MKHTVPTGGGEQSINLILEGVIYRLTAKLSGKKFFLGCAHLDYFEDIWQKGIEICDSEKYGNKLVLFVEK